MVWYWTLLRLFHLLLRLLLMSNLRPWHTLLQDRCLRSFTRSWRPCLDVFGTWNYRWQRGGDARRNRLRDLNTTLRIAVLWHPKVSVTFDRRVPMRWGMSRHALLLPRLPQGDRFHLLSRAAQPRPQTLSDSRRIRWARNLLRLRLRLWRMPLLLRPLQTPSRRFPPADDWLRPLCPLRSPVC